MKKIIQYISLSLLVAAGLSSCHKVAVDITSELTPDTYPQTAAQFQSATGPVYVALRANYSLDFWFMQSLSSNEAILPAFGGNWYDGDKYEQLHKHTWTKDNAWVNSCWSYLENVIGTVNQTISILSAAAESSTKTTTLAELKTVRALSYFYLMDLYGNVPLDTVYGNTTLHTNTARAQVFSFVETELKAALPSLNRVSGHPSTVVPMPILPGRSWPRCISTPKSIRVLPAGTIALPPATASSTRVCMPWKPAVPIWPSSIQPTALRKRSSSSRFLMMPARRALTCTMRVMI